MTEQIQQVFSNFATLRRLGRAHLFSVVKDSGLAASQLEALFAIDKLQPVSFKDLGCHLSQQPAAITQTIDSLVEAHLVERKHSQKDRRTWHISLSSTGTEKLAALKPELEKRKKTITEALSHDEIDQLIYLQQKLIQHLQTKHQTKE
jgi:DNA-binding MarR family transcriptional regulator